MEQIISGSNIEHKNPAVTSISSPAAKIVREELVSISEPLHRSIVDASFNSISKVSTVRKDISWFFPQQT
jgi:hypothetical protein